MLYWRYSACAYSCFVKIIGSMYFADDGDLTRRLAMGYILLWNEIFSSGVNSRPPCKRLSDVILSRRATNQTVNVAVNIFAESKFLFRTVGVDLGK